MKRVSTILFACVACATYPAHAQNSKIPVYIQFSGQDDVGKQLDFYLKEQIRKSGAFAEVFNEKESTFVIPLVTIDPDDQGVRTVYSYSILIENRDGLNYFVTSYVGGCGKRVVEQCSASLFGQLGAKLEDIRRALLASAQTAPDN